MGAHIALFELRKRLGYVSTYVYIAVFLALAFLLEIAAGGAFSSVSVGMGSEKVWANAPHALHGSIATLSTFGVLVTAAVFGQAVHQDLAAGVHPLFFTTPVSRAAYLGGRFAGAFLTVAVIFASIAVGLWLGAASPFVEASLFGKVGPAAYVWPYLTIVLPNLLWMGGLFFALGTLGRRMMPVYVGGVVLLIGWLIAGTFGQKLDHRTLGALVDPFGLVATSRLTEYWTVDERNTLLVRLDGVLAWNRLLWVAVGAAALGWTLVRFRFADEGERSRREAPPAVEPPPAGIPAALVAPRTAADVAYLFWRETWLAFRETVKNVYFLVIVLAGVLFLIFASRVSGAIYGTETYPVTYAVLELAHGSFGLFMLILITLYSGELVWRERDARMDQLLDAQPTPAWLPLGSRLAALGLVMVVLGLAISAGALGIQLSQGYFRLELPLYASDLGLRLVDYWLLCALAIAVQAVVQHKYLGHFLMVVYYLATLFMGRLGLEHNLLRYGGAPEWQYSDMNGYGHFLRPVFWFDLYWACWALLLAVVAHLLWARGTETRMRLRVRIARRRLGLRAGALAALGVAGAAAAGGFVYWNTNVKNRYRTAHDREAAQAEYEKRYRPLLGKPQPRVVDVKVAIDIEPERPRLRARGTYVLENRTAEPIAAVYVNLEADQAFDRLTVGGAAPTRSDHGLGWHVFELPAPLAPGQRVPLELDLPFESRYFKNGGFGKTVVGNGTFFNSGALPSIGYQKASELTEDNTRKKYGLPPRPRMPDLDDAAARRNNYISADADWVAFDATVSTSPDQVAIAPGYLQREWSEGGRRFFHYRMDARILHFFSVLSARYQVRRDRWKDVALEIHHHPGHEYNLDAMMRAMKASLAYCERHFGPYQHRQARILEFPRYETFAQSFPNTIPYSEGIGFIARVDPTDEDDIDYPLYVTAHEIAHQWWAHQAIGADVQGAAMLSETLSQYTALMVMKETFGPARMRRFLRYELDRYLGGRAMERKKELPLERVEDQPYIYYNKGSLVMYALQDLVGEEQVNLALRRFLERVRFQEPPYTTTRELIAELRRVTPPEHGKAIEDLFETITLWDNRAVSAGARKVGDRWEVTLKVSARKLRAGELGKETEVPLDDLVDVGVVDDRGDPIVLERRRLTGKELEVTLVADRPPARAGIDPSNKLIDRKPDDNVVPVVIQ